MENRMYDSRPYGDGYRPHFGMFLPLLVIPLMIGMMRHFAGHKYMRMHEGQGPESWRQHGVPPIFAELHRRAHAAEAAEAAKAAPAAQPQAQA